MRHFVWAQLLALTLGLPAAMAQDARPDARAEIRSAQSMLPQCIAGLAAGAADPAGGRCGGIIATLSFVSRVLPDNLKFCHPNTATPDQMLQVVISFVESNPDAASQDFRLVALAAMHHKWPCQE